MRTAEHVRVRQADLILLIAHHFPELDLSDHVCRWHTLPDDRHCLAVDDGSVLFTPDGADLLVTGSVPGGAVQCWRVSPDGKTHLALTVPDPYCAAQAALN